MDWIEDGLIKAKGQAAVTADLLHHQAALCSLRGEYDQAIALYNRVLDLKPNKDVAGLTMNNLAFLLAANKGKFADALARIENAKQLVGPLPELLDTEALVRLKLAEKNPAMARESVKTAIDLLEDVEVQAPSAVIYFHLAHARFALATLEGQDGKKAAAETALVHARSAWEEAQRQNLTRGELHPLEWDDFKLIKDKLK
jgi:tetratricopeptide (TPR) repeat protein